MRATEKIYFITLYGMWSRRNVFKNFLRLKNSLKYNAKLVLFWSIILTESNTELLYKTCNIRKVHGKVN